jgi:hypothetical protein
MSYRRNLLIMTAVVLGLGFGPASAQNDEDAIETFIRDDRSSATARTARPDQMLPRQSDDADPAEEARRPDPETVIVALVNGHIMTRAELDRKVRARLNNSDVEDNSATFGDQGFVLVLGGPTRTMTQEAVTQYRQDRDLEYRDMIIGVEGEIVREWMEYKILSDEARRQGIIISEREFQARLDEINRDYDLNNRSVEEILRQFGMSRADLDAYISDALLIDKLLDRYVEINKPDTFLKAQYERNPDLFITPPSYRIAHFSISVPDAKYLHTNRRMREDYFKSLERTMNTVRQRLNKKEDAETVFAEFNDPENGTWGTVLDTNLVAGSMPDNLRKAILELKEGETTRVQQVSVRHGDSIVPETYHVVRLEKIYPPGGTTFASALPRLRKVAKEAAKEELLGILMAKGSTHRRMSNLGGLDPTRLPDRAELMMPKPGIDLRIGSMSTTASASPTRTRTNRAVR